MAEYTIKRNDTAPVRVVLTTNKQPVNLQGAAVRWHMVPVFAGRGASVDVAATVVQSVDGQGKIVDQGVVEWRPLAAQVSQAGAHRAEWEVVFQDGTRETFPREGWLDFVVEEDLG